MAQVCACTQFAVVSCVQWNTGGGASLLMMCLHAGMHDLGHWPGVPWEQQEKVKHQALISSMALQCDWRSSGRLCIHVSPQIKARYGAPACQTYARGPPAAQCKHCRRGSERSCTSRPGGMEPE